MFDPVFLSDPSFKSTFALKQSCRSSLPLQLLFWPNFMFPYENLGFGWSKLGLKKFVKLHCSSHVSSLCAPCCDRPRVGPSQRSTAERARAYPVLVPSPFSPRLRPLPQAHAEQAEQSPLPAAVPTIPRRPAPFSHAPEQIRLASNLLRPISSSIEPLPGRIGLRRRGRHCRSSPELRPLRRSPTSGSSSPKSSPR